MTQDYDFPERDRVLQVYPCGYHKVGIPLQFMPSEAVAAQTGRTGHPIYIERVGQLDVDALLQITTVDRYIRCLHSASFTQITTDRVQTPAGTMCKHTRTC